MEAVRPVEAVRPCGVSGLVRNEILHEAVHLPCRERVFATGEQNHMLGLTLRHSTSYCEIEGTYLPTYTL